MSITEKGFKSRPSGSEARRSFEKSFGHTLDLSTDEYGAESNEYWNPMKGVDKKDDIAKSFASMQKDTTDTQTGGAAPQAGTALVPIFVDDQLVDRSRKETPLRNILPRRATRGLTYDYIPVKEKRGAQFAAEGAAIEEGENVYDRQSVDIKFMYAKGRVTGPLLAATEGFIDPMSIDQNLKQRDLIELEEDTIINGNSTSNIREFDGLIQQIQTNVLDKSGSLPTLQEVRAQFTASYNNNGNIDLVVTDSSTHNYLKGLLDDRQRNDESPTEDQLGFGIPGDFGYDGRMFIKSKFMPRSSNSKRMLFLDLDYIFMAVLQDLTVEALPQENDTTPFMMKMYEALVVTHEAAFAQIKGIS